MRFVGTEFKAEFSMLAASIDPVRDSKLHGPFESSTPLWLLEVGSMCFGGFEFMNGSSLYDERLLLSRLP
jgi:hypothetical protein